MRHGVWWLWVVGLSGLATAAADAQTPSPPAGMRFDGTYAFVSSTKINQTYRTRGGLMGQCPDRITGTFTIAQGQAQYTTASGYRLQGTVGPRGEFSMRSQTPPGSNGFQPLEIIVNGTVDSTGTVHARQVSNSCGYNFTWRKEAR